jgi:hypothetical protein
MFHFNIFNSDNHQTMKHHDKVSRKTILTLYLSLSILFTFILCVESSVNVTANVTANVTITTNSTDDKSSPSPSPSPFNQRTVTIITYSIISLMFGIPILTFLACIYHMKGSAPCNFKEAFCNCC